MSARNGTKRILVVDDDAAFRTALIEELDRYNEFATIQAGTATQGFEEAKRARPNAVLLDVGLPDMDGRELCKLMRHHGMLSPIIMLTAAASDDDTVLGLEAGANDYVAKPVRTNVLLARLRTHLRQYERSEDAVLTIGPYEFHPTAKMLIGNDGKRKIRLTGRETLLLKFLFQASDQAVPRDVILTEVWGYNTEVTTHTLETHIYRLRQKIEKNPKSPALLISEKSLYRLRP